jgi:hypothetical protein
VVVPLYKKKKRKRLQTMVWKRNGKDIIFKVFVRADRWQYATNKEAS